MQLLSSDGQLFELSDAAARQSFYLQDLAEDVDDGAPVPVELLDSGRLQRTTALLEQTAAAFGLEGMADERRNALLKNGLPRGDMGPQLRAATAAVLEGVDGLADFATLLLDLKSSFDAPLPTSILAEGVARLLSGKSADELRTLLEAKDDLGDQEKEKALREFLPFTPPAAVPAAVAPPPLARSVSLAMDEGAEDEGNMMACLERCDVRTLRQLKAVSAGWQQRARRALLYHIDAARCALRDGRALRDVRCGIDAAELDVEGLSHLGLLHEAVAAARQMPNLARLRGYGFRVELDGPQGVRQARMGGGDPEGPLGGAVLRSCIHEGEGEPPHELLLAAVACAKRGKVLGVPVQRLREDDAINLNLDGQHGRGVIGGVIGVELLSLMLPAATSLRELSIGCSNVGAEGASVLAAVLKETKITTLRLDNNQLCGIDQYGRGTYTAEGITKLCEGLKGSAVTSLSIGRNGIGDEGASALAAVLKETKITTLRVASDDITGDAAEKLAMAVLEHASMTDFCEIPLVSLRENSITELDLERKHISVPELIVLSKLLPSAVALTSLNLANNELCGLNNQGRGTYTTEGITKLCEGLKGNAVTSLNLSQCRLGFEGGAALAEGLKGNSTLQSLDLECNQLCGIHQGGRGTYTAEGITKLCEALKGSAMTSLKLGHNCIGGWSVSNTEGIIALGEWLKGSSVTSLNLDWNFIGVEGISVLAAILKDTQITKLSITNNDIGAEGAFTLAAILKETQIQQLDLGMNQLCGLKGLGNGTYTTEGITKLCEGLKGSSVTSLDLAGNELCGLDEYSHGTYTTEGITKLCEGLKGSAVTSLKLANNQLCGLYSELGEVKGTYIAEGITKLCEGLKGSAVTSLSLKCNCLRDEDKQALKDAAGSSVHISF